jgi:predicted nucleic acid-binding protein
LIVIDASTMVFALSSPSAQGDAARSVLAQDHLWLAPAHMPLEVIRTLRKAVDGGAMTEDDVVAAFQALDAAEITYVGMTPLLLRAVWAMRHKRLAVRRRLPRRRCAVRGTAGDSRQSPGQGSRTDITADRSRLAVARPPRGRAADLA